MVKPAIVAYTKPQVKTYANSVAFKTQKLLAGRALVADDFFKSALKADGTSDLVTAAPVNMPGFAARVHQDGYNILYGDGSAVWFGDAEQKVMYWDTSLAAADGHAQGLGSTSHYWGMEQGIGTPHTKYDTPLVWHGMDAPRDIDVGADCGRY